MKKILIISITCPQLSEYSIIIWVQAVVRSYMKVIKKQSEMA